MPFYYFNTQLDEHFRHEVHTEDCSHLPKVEHQMMIGLESSCQNAIARAKRQNPQESFDGCYWCCRECNKG